MLMSAILMAAVMTPSATAMTLRYVSYNVPDPMKSATFFKKYVNGVLLTKGDLLISNFASSTTVAAGLRIPFLHGSWHTYTDIYFWSDPDAPGASHANNFSNEIERGILMAPNVWSFWQDRHLAFGVDNLESTMARLLHDRVPFYNYYQPGPTIYITGPGGVTVQLEEHTPRMVSWAWGWGPFKFCERTYDQVEEYIPWNLTEYESLAVRPLPTSYRIMHNAFPVVDAFASQRWSHHFLHTVSIDVSALYEGGRTYEAANGNCGEVAWSAVSDKTSQFHFVKQKFKRQGRVHVADHISELNQMRGDTLLKSRDPFFFTRLGFAVDDIAPYASRLSASKGTFAVEESHLLVQTPWGELFDLFDVSSGVAGTFDDHALYESNCFYLGNLCPGSLTGKFAFYVDEDERGESVVAWPPSTSPKVLSLMAALSCFIALIVVLNKRISKSSLL